MSEATASTNMETANNPQASNDNTPQAANDNTAVNTLSGGDGAQEGQIETGMSGPAEAVDQPSAGPTANDNMPQAANDVAQDPGDLAGQAKRAGDVRTEATGDLAVSSARSAPQRLRSTSASPSCGTSTAKLPS
jgi:hypothetical protein